MEPARFVIDRVVDGVATLEPLDGGARVDVPAAWLPAGSREGDVVAVQSTRAHAHAELVFALDEQARREREERIGALRASLPRAPRGDIEL